MRSSIGGYVKSVQVDDMSAPGDVAGICLGSGWESWCHCQRRFQQLVGMKMWSGCLAQSWAC